MIGQRIACLYENVTLDPYGEIQQKGRRGHGVTDVSLCDTATTIVSVIHTTSVMGWTVSPKKRMLKSASSCLLRLLLAGTVSQTLLFLTNLRVLKSSSQVFSRMSLNRDFFFDAFSS